MHTKLRHQSPASRVEWHDFDANKQMLLFRNRKDPGKTTGNDPRIPLSDVSGYDACKIIEEQGRFSNIRVGRIFPYNGRSVATAFRRQCRGAFFAAQILQDGTRYDAGNACTRR